MNPDVLTAVASERRRRILRLLWETELSAGDLAGEFDVSWPAISQHLGVLKDAGLIRERRDGRHRLYSADSETVGLLESVLTAMWRSDLDRLTRLAEAEDRDAER